jgi:hypothetical protein
MAGRGLSGMVICRNAKVMTGIGPVPVKVPRLRDRATGAEKIRFTSAILPPYLRKAKSVEELLPWLYLKGIPTGDFQEAVAALLGPSATGLSATTISRLKAGWWDEYERWQRREPSLSGAALSSFCRLRVFGGRRRLRRCGHRLFPGESDQEPPGRS